MGKARIEGFEKIGPAAQVLIIEGLQDLVDSVQARVPTWMAVVTWPAVTGGMESIDWSPIFAKKVILWPASDEWGIENATEIGRHIVDVVEQLKIIDVARPAPLDDEDLRDWLAKGISLWEDPVDQAAEPEPEKEKKTPKPRKPDNGATFSGPEETIERRTKALPFHILGQHGARVYFLKGADGRILDYPLTSIPRKEVLGTLAPPKIWKDAFGGLDPEGNPLGWPTIGQAAQAHIMTVIERLPEFDPENTRGRGCWMHKNQFAFNRGDRVELDGTVLESNYIDHRVYERGSPLPIESDQQLTDEEGLRLLSLLEQCTWAEGHASLCLGGWIAIAPICGALTWRPHVWLTGPHGCGKSTIARDIIRPAIGKGCISMGGNTTEAGLRQTINHDSLPVIIDETEPGEKSSIATILTLARSASSGDTIVRGSASQDGAHRYQIRSSFCFSAINPDIDNAADESRITLLHLRKGEGAADDKRFKEMWDDLANLVDEDFGARLSARMIALGPTTLRTIELIEDAVTARFGSRRLAQQFGAMLGGVHALRSRKPITKTEAEYMATLVPNITREALVEEDDHQRMVQHFLAYQIDVPGPKGGHIKMAVGELVERVSSPFSDGAAADMAYQDAEDILKRWGFRVTERKHAEGTRKFALVAKKHPQMKKLFRDTTWVNTYADRFKDLEGAKNGSQNRFAGGRFSTVDVPLDKIIGGNDESEMQQEL